MISALVFLPAFFALVLLCVPRSNTSLLKGIALAGALGTFALSTVLLPIAPAGIVQNSYDWIHGAVAASYHVRVDGISVWFVLLTTFLTIPAVAAAFTYRDTARLRGYLALLLGFEWTLLGLFTAGDLLLFYIYWDLMLIPVFLVLVAYADTPDSRRAAWGYLIYNLAGGLVLLAGVIGVVLKTHTFEVMGNAFAINAELQRWLFAAFAFAFLIKTPVFPFHAWMPAAYTQSPPSLVSIISGVQSKAGLYGFIVFALPLFPDAAHYFAPALLVLAVSSIVYGALCAMAERNAKTLVAYTSLSHLGLVLLALFAFDFTSLPAGILMIVSHGVIAAALFLLVGFIEERTATNELGAYGGLQAVAPRLWVFMLIAAMALLGLPGLSGFAGEFLILLGAWQTQPVYASFGLFTIVLAAAYALRLLQGTMHGPYRLPADVPAPKDLQPRELALVAPLLAAIFFFGIWPAWLNDRVPASSTPSSSTSQLVRPPAEHRS